MAAFNSDQPRRKSKLEALQEQASAEDDSDEQADEAGEAALLHQSDADNADVNTDEETSVTDEDDEEGDMEAMREVRLRANK